jgi:hypothetical protein
MFLCGLITTLALGSGDLQSVPYENGTLGIRVLLPKTGVVTALSTSPPSCLVSSDNPLAGWHLRFDRLPNPSGEIPREIVRVAHARRVDPPGTTILEDRTLAIGELEGWWLAISQPGETPNETATILGWMAVPAPGGQAILAAVFCPEPAWQRDRGVLMASLQSLLTIDPITQATDRLAGLEGASARLAALNKSSLAGLVGFDEWRRIRTEHGEDIGYGRIRVQQSDTPQVDGTGGGEGGGLLIHVQARVVPDPESGIVVDTTGQYWVSWDGQGESWTGRSTRWKGKISRSQIETGLRPRPSLGTPNPRLLVIQQDASAIDTATFDEAVFPPFMPKALTWVIGPWLAGDPDATQFAWHSYDDSSTLPQIVMRTDSFERQGDGSVRVSTRLGERDTRMITIFTDDGRLIRQIQPGGVEVTGSDAATLEAVWEPRGLW